MFRKVLVANRGEIAVRIARALREVNIASVAVFSDADRAALHVRLADEAAHIGPAPSSQSYLAVDRILEVAKTHQVDAIHPGYGFLSENAEFSDACSRAGFVFIGPSGDSIRRLGSKTAGRTVAKSVNVPIVPGTEEPVRNLSDARQWAEQIGYPVLLKAAAGGGGKGMRRVDAGKDLESAIREASSEAERAFHNSEVYIEKLIEKPRHIEIQIAGDLHGNLVHLGERECSLQRRHQKVLEECPSPFVVRHPELRQKMGEAALRIARAANYYNLGTVEFLVDDAGNFYFLEVNTRLQVEHPVTELVTGLDLVHLQLRIAAGEKLPFTQQDIEWRGWAMECRICAEDPENAFFPSPGRIEQLREPGGPHLRLDSGVYAGWTVPLEYDSLLAKLVATGPDREATIRRLLRGLREYSITGIESNLSFFRQLLNDAQFREGALHTGFVEDFMARRKTNLDPSKEAEFAVAVAAAAAHSTRKEPGARSQESTTRWLTEGRSHLQR